MKERAKKLISNRNNILILYILITLIAGIQALTSGTKTNEVNGLEYNRYNNYTIFERSFYHLKNNQDLYALYPEEHWDLYKYTPTFSVFFGLFAVFPDWIGLNLWNLLNTILLLVAVYYLPRLNNLEKGLVLITALIELLTSIQNEQSNGLIAGLLVLAFGLLENKKYLFATLCIVFSAYIKLFGIVGYALFLLYPKKWKLAVYSALWTVILFAIPLLFVDYKQYIWLFQSYSEMLSQDHSTSYGFSVMGWLNSWFGLEVNKNMVVLIGAVIFLIPLSRRKAYSIYSFRYLTLASILIWIVIFNHMAESPTFIIAMTGVALWFVRSEKNALNVTLFVGAVIFTMLSPTDLFPKFLREEYVRPLTLKGVPCILIWAKVIYDMLVLKNDTVAENTTQNVVFESKAAS
ncbi:glycosyltransferase family 87 protein [Pontibacter brevis]